MGGGRRRCCTRARACARARAQKKKQHAHALGVAAVIIVIIVARAAASPTHSHRANLTLWRLVAEAVVVRLEHARQLAPAPAKARPHPQVGQAKHLFAAHQLFLRDERRALGALLVARLHRAAQQLDLLHDLGRVPHVAGSKRQLLEEDGVGEARGRLVVGAAGVEADAHIRVVAVLVGRDGLCVFERVCV